MIQGDVYWVKLKEPDKTRPVLILTRTSAIPELNSLVVAAITTTLREVRSQVLLGPDDGMPKDCVVNLDNLHTVNKSLFRAYITHLPKARMQEVFDAMKFAFGFSE
jgi:mRNA interferase MazF